MCLFLWRATVSAWIYGKVLGFCSKPRLALSVKKDGKGTVHFLCCHTGRAIPWLSLRQHVEHRTNGVPDLLVTPRSAVGFPSDCPVGSEHSSLLSFPLRNDDSICSDDGEPSSTCAPAPGCPGDVTVTGQGTASSPAPQHWDTQPPPAASLGLLLPGSSLWEDFMNLNTKLINRKYSCFPLLNLTLHYLQSIPTSVPPDWVLSPELL